MNFISGKYRETVRDFYSSSINASHRFLYHTRTKDIRLMTRNYEPNLDWRVDQWTHRFRQSVYGAFPYPNLARDVTRTLCDIGATLGKNKEPVTSNRATHEPVWRGHRIANRRRARSIVKGYRSIFYSWRLTSCDATRFSIAEIFLTSDSLHEGIWLHIPGGICTLS